MGVDAGYETRSWKLETRNIQLLVSNFKHPNQLPQQ